jgi:uncharacterized secreted protein with C-terminal beta-propeller domain
MLRKRVSSAPEVSSLFRLPRIVWYLPPLWSLAFATGCWVRQDTETGVPGLVKFESPEDLKAYLADQVADRLLLLDGPIGLFDVAVAVPAPTPQDGSPAEAGQAEFSTTNLQEDGVDESDVVKNDATYIYMASKGKLKIVRGVPAEEMELTASLDLPGNPTTLYLKGERLIALGASDESGSSSVAVVNISDRRAPSVEASLEIPGTLVTSRMIGSALHMVMQLPTARLEMSTPDQIRATELDELIPAVTVSRPGSDPLRQKIVEWRDFYRPVDADGYRMTAIVTVNVKNPEQGFSSVAVVADPSVIYASPEAIYLTDREYNPFGDVRETTDIYKFDLTEAGPVPSGAGSVPGRVLNRFSLGEHEGYLRAATTSRKPNAETWMATSNNVYVLAAGQGELKIVGRLEGIAPGESIYSARFLGDRGFLVTFEQIDPLATLDLSDPTAPGVVGELKVTGYSDYIHPLGENHLLTIGKDVQDAGSFPLVQGVQISVFDVTDFSQPQQVDVEIIGNRGTESEALKNPHAFNYFERAGMLAVPMEIHEGPVSEPRDLAAPTFAGVCLYQVSAESGIEPLGRIKTGEAASYLWGTQGWTRSIFLDGYLYAVTDSAVRALPLNDPSAVPVELPLE